jgi:type I restriction enzyme, S subunit
MKKYPKMKDSEIEWIGKIPEHWNVKRLKHVTKFSLGLVINPSDYFDEKGNIPIITGKNVSPNGIDLSNTDLITSESNNQLKQSQIFSDDIVTMRVGYAGRSAVVKSSEHGINCASLIITRSSINHNSNFVCSVLNSPIGNSQVLMNQNGMAQQVVNLSSWKNFVMLMPSKLEQNIISKFLDKKTAKIDSYISKNQKLMLLLKEKRQSIINQAITKGLDTSVPMKDSRIEWIRDTPKHWEVKSLKFTINMMTEFASNGSFAGLRKNVHYLFEPDYARLVRLTDLRKNVNNKNGIWIDQDSYEYLKKSKLFGDEILMANVGAYAGIFFRMPKISEKASLAPNMIILKFNSNQILPDFFMYASLSQHVVDRLKQLSLMTSAQPKIDKTGLKQIKIICPPITEQQQIISFLNKIIPKVDLVLSKTQSQLEKLYEYRKSITSSIVTGKIDVRGAAA